MNETPVIAYDYLGEGTLQIERACPVCHRFIKATDIKQSVNGLGETRVTAECGKCGSIQPNYDWI